MRLVHAHWPSPPEVRLFMLLSEIKRPTNAKQPGSVLRRRLETSSAASIIAVVTTNVRQIAPLRGVRHCMGTGVSVPPTFA
jgi:hypothetical protein